MLLNLHNELFVRLLHILDIPDGTEAAFADMLLKFETALKKYGSIGLDLVGISWLILVCVGGPLLWVYDPVILLL